jgi:hypothetical protein
MMAMAMAMLRDACREQAALVRELWQNRRTRAPFEVVCLAAFGSSLHEAVTSFFYLRLGASTTDVGQLSGVILGTGLVVDPLLGAWMDAKGGLGAMVLASFLCALGCFLRGLARNVSDLYAAAAILGLGGSSLDLVVLTYLGAVLRRGRRSAVLAGFVVCRGLLQLAAKAAFPPFNALLRLAFPGDGSAGGSAGGNASDGEMMRFRVSLSVCWFFCFYGVLRIAHARRHLIREPLGAYAHRNEGANTVTAIEPHHHHAASKLASSLRSSSSSEALQRAHHHPPSSGPWHPWWAFALAAAAVLLNAVAMTAVVVLWPLIVKDQFDWSASEFAILVLVSTSLLMSALLARSLACLFAPVALGACMHSLIK